MQTPPVYRQPLPRCHRYEPGQADTLEKRLTHLTHDMTTAAPCATA
ncbi:hypothetical protein ACF1GY_37595 [Streptomyces sp. NPDC014684]